MLRVGLGGISGTNILSVGRGVSVGGGGGCAPVDRIDGDVAAGATFMHPADGVIAVDVDGLGSDAGILFDFRQRDEANHWQIRITSTGLFVLNRVVSGTVTGIVSGGTVSPGQRIAVAFSGSTITGYINSVQQWTYASATQFATETNGDIDSLGGTTKGTLSDLKTWTLACSGQEGVRIAGHDSNYYVAPAS